MSTKMKERMKVLRSVEKVKITEDTVEDKIKITESRIKLCEEDLEKISFKGNRNIINKVKVLKEQLEKLKNVK